MAESHFRFGAAAAYHELVQRRVAELREERIQGLQTFQEFIERRLAPAMSTCRSVSRRPRVSTRWNGTGSSMRPSSRYGASFENSARFMPNRKA